MNFRSLLACSLLALLAACDAVGLATRNANMTLNPGAVMLAAGGTLEATVTMCPGIIDSRNDGAFYQGGAHTLAIEGLPDGVSASWPDGQIENMPGTVSLQRSLGFGDPGESSDTRFCWTKRLRLQRDASAAAADVRVDARVVYRSASADVERVLSIQLPASGAGTPPVATARCSAGRWTDVAAPAAALVSTAVFDATLLDDRVFVARAAADSVLVDEQSAGGWLQRAVRTAGSPDSLHLRVAELGSERTLQAAWRDIDYGRPREAQAQVVLATRNAVGVWVQQVVAADFESNVRGLMLEPWQGQPVLGWLSAGGLELRRLDATAGWQTLASPAELPYDGTMRQARLAVDPSDQSLWLLAATRDADGVTRLRVWRRTPTAADWVALPVLEAGPSSGPADLLRGLGSVTLAAQRGEAVLAWTYGDATFSSSARQALQVRRATAAAPAWQAVGDTATLLSPTARYAWQPQALQAALACGGTTFLAWSEPGDYPFGAVQGAVADAATDLWDTFGRVDLAPLSAGTGAYGSQPRLLVPSDGRPLLVVLLAPPSGGPAPVIVRRFAP
jgi:hypothetical protein